MTSGVTSANDIHDVTASATNNNNIADSQVKVSTLAAAICDKFTCEEDCDPDVINSMVSLGCFRDKPKLIRNLMMKESVVGLMFLFLITDHFHLG